MYCYYKMIPPNKYLTFAHKFFGKKNYQNIDKLYIEFIKNPDKNTCESFSNKLDDIEMQVLNECTFCIIFVLPPNSKYIMGSVWKNHKEERDRLLKCVTKYISEDNMIVAWDVFFKKSDKKLNNACAVIGLESIMDITNTWFNKDVMIPGNIFITNKGQVIGNKMTVNDCIELFDEVYGQKQKIDS